MAKLSDEEQSLLDKLTAKAAQEEDDRPVKFTARDGSSLEGPFSRVAAFAEALGVRLAADKTPEPEGEEGTVKRFTSGRRTG